MFRVALFMPESRGERIGEEGIKRIPGCVCFGQLQYFWILLLAIFWPGHTNYFYPINFTQRRTAEKRPTKLYNLSQFCSLSWKMSSMLMAFIVIPLLQKGHSTKTPIKGTFNSARPTLLRSFEFKHLTADFTPRSFVFCSFLIFSMEVDGHFHHSVKFLHPHITVTRTGL